MKCKKGKADSDARTLRRLMSGGPTVSVYFNLPVPTGSPEVAVRWRAVLKDLARYGVVSSVRGSLTRRVLSMPPGPGVLAAFVADGDTQPTVVEMPGARQPDLVLHAALPHVSPMLTWLQERPPYVLALVGRNGADIEIHPGGTEETIVRTVTGPAGDIGASAPGHRSAQAHGNGEDPWERNAGCVAEALAGELTGGRPRLLLLAGDIRALHHVDQHLPRGLRRHVCVRYVPGGSCNNGSWHLRGPQVEQQLRSWAAEQNQRLLRRIAEGRNANGWVVEGAAATLRALSRGRGRVLAIVDDPEDHRTAWFAYASTEASLSRESFPRTDSEPVRSAALIDVALRTAVLTGAEIRILLPATPNATVEGIGALCRFGG